MLLYQGSNKICCSSEFRTELSKLLYSLRVISREVFVSDVASSRGLGSLVSEVLESANM